ncbi:MAG: hypothetical protein EOM20_06160 [Spartobacteria bacterium]|nr:hypothetical protein [Spartobacteria bacterium]
MAWVAVAALPVDNRRYLRTDGHRACGSPPYGQGDSNDWLNALLLSGEEDDVLSVWDRKDRGGDAVLQST